MDEKALKALLWLIPVAVLTLAIILPLPASGWDTTNALFGGDPLIVVDSFREAGELAGADYFTPNDFGLSEDKTLIILKGTVKNPYDAEMIITGLVYRATVGDETTDLILSEQALIPAGAESEITLTAPASKKQIRTISSGENISFPDNALAEISIRLHGIKITAAGD